MGYTRERNNKPAGFRTHILVCFGAAIISMVQDQLRLNIMELARANVEIASVVKTDLGRLGAQVCKWNRIFRCRKYNEGKR